MAMRDATEYQFARPGRRVLVREAQADVGIEAAAQAYEASLRTLLGAIGVSRQGPVSTPGGAEAVVVEGTMPGGEGAGAREGDSVVRAAFLRFGDGPVAELSLHAPAGEAGAEEEFRRLLRTARPSGQADPVRAVARAIQAGPVGRHGYPAGPIELQLSPDYRGPEQFALASADGSARYRLEAPTAEAAPTRSVVEGTILGAGIGLARDEDGRTVRYEAGARPRLYSRPRAQPQAAPEAVRLTRGAEGRPAAGSPGEVVVDGVVRGKPVRIRVSAPDGGDARSLAEELMNAMNRPE